jgi:hypothetical protein
MDKKTELIKNKIPLIKEGDIVILYDIKPPIWAHCWSRGVWTKMGFYLVISHAMDSTFNIYNSINLCKNYVYKIDSLGDVYILYTPKEYTVKDLSSEEVKAYEIIKEFKQKNPTLPLTFDDKIWGLVWGLLGGESNNSISKALAVIDAVIESENKNEKEREKSI